MPVPRRRRSKARRDRGRTHKKLSAATVGTCPECGHPKRPHHACTNPSCGIYRGRQVLTEPIST
jgi:large subunit ribosomal protein L32